jgi:hypothetical protein
MTATPLDGELRDGRHTMSVRVYYEDTDFTGGLGIQTFAPARRIGHRLMANARG